MHFLATLRSERANAQTGLVEAGLAFYTHFWFTYRHMGFVSDFLPYIQVAISLLLIASILLQQRGSSVGGAFGNDAEGATFYTRRGGEKWLFQATIVLAVLFALSAFAALLLKV